MPQSGVAARADERRTYRERRAVAVDFDADGLWSERSYQRRPQRDPDDRRPVPGDGAPGRRTVTIRGRGAERYVPPPRAGDRRRYERRYERAGVRPDRVAMWAVLLGLAFILAAVSGAHAAVLPALAHLH